MFLNVCVCVCVYVCAHLCVCSDDISGLYIGYDTYSGSVLCLI